jgi:hypothetical protein
VPSHNHLNCSTSSKEFESGTSQQLTMDLNSQPSPRLGYHHWVHGDFIPLLTGCMILPLSISYWCGPSLGWKRHLKLFIFYLIKYHHGNIIEVMSDKASFLKKLLKKHIKKKSCFVLHGLFQVITSFDCLSS